MATMDFRVSLPKSIGCCEEDEIGIKALYRVAAKKTSARYGTFRCTG